MKRPLEMLAAGVVGAVLSVFITQVADATGRLAFAIIACGTLLAGGAVQLGMRRRERNRRLHAQIAKVAAELPRVIERLDAVERQHDEDVAALRRTQEDDRVRAIERLRETVGKLGDLLNDTARDTAQTRQLVLPNWLRVTEAWAIERGWSVAYKGSAIEFSRDQAPQHTALVQLPLGSHQEEEATRTALYKHLGYPGRRTLVTQIGAMTRVLGRGDT